MISDLARAQYDIVAFLSRQSEWICRLDGQLYGRMRSERVAVTREFGKLILTLWGEDFAECWRIEDYEIVRDRLLLRVGRHPGRPWRALEFCAVGSSADSEPETLERRRAFESTICRMLERHGGARVEYVATRRDDVAHLSGIYTRMILRCQGEPVVAIAVNSDEPPPHVDGLLAAGLIWWTHVARRTLARRLMLLAPAGRIMRLARRLTAVRQDEMRIELYEVDERREMLRPVTPFDQGMLFDPRRVRLPRVASPLPPHPLRERVLALAPDVLRISRRPGSLWESVRIRGLEIARLSPRRAVFGIGSAKKGIEEEWEAFEHLVHTVARIRHPESPEKTHPLYRIQAERWLEEMIRDDPRRVDARLDPRFLYPQISAHGAEGYGLVDLLGITEDRQLALIELKVEEDPELPLQAVDYWLRIEWHRRRGDFSRRGYFPGIEIADRPTLALVVAPVLRFHRTFDLLARWIDPSVPLYKIGIAEEWRQGVRVISRERANG